MPSCKAGVVFFGEMRRSGLCAFTYRGCKLSSGGLRVCVAAVPGLSASDGASGLGCWEGVGNSGRGEHGIEWLARSWKRRRLLIAMRMSRSRSRLIMVGDKSL